MPTTFDIISGLTSSKPSDYDNFTLVNQFSEELGWVPSYSMRPYNSESFVNAHLVVEHGLQNSAIISFLTKPYYDLSNSEKTQLLNLSYNNLVDWHIHVEKGNITFVNNRVSPNKRVVKSLEYSRGNYDALRSEAFEQIIGEKSTPNIPSLDQVLIETVKYWKIHLSAEYNNKLSNVQFSSIFNAVFFIRAVEDNAKRFGRIERDSRVLTSQLQILRNLDGKFCIADLFRRSLDQLNCQNVPEYLIDYNELVIFEDINNDVWTFLFNDFYDNRRSSHFSYDFSIMSHHAMSRIYERYISLLGVEEDDQLTMFTPLATETYSSDTGAVFTPQYIARFFARYLKEYLPPFDLKRIKVAEPAVGSGIFLRTLLEVKCDPRESYVDTENINQSFSNIFGLDIDLNAVKATQLSLALLHLTITDSFPSELKILHEDSLSYWVKNKEGHEKYDVVLSNPPFISIENQSAETRNHIKSILGSLAQGRMDSYLAFLKIGLDLLNDGGHAMYVIPHSFLLAKNAKKLREYISNEYAIKCIVDLSAVPVFGNTGIYVVLLIIQKGKRSNLDKTLVIKCQNDEGSALQAGLRREYQDNKSYSVYEIEQSFFSGKEWFILPKSEIDVKVKLSSFPSINEFLDVRQGYVSGKDKIFVLEESKVESLNGKDLFVPVIRDKEMDKYSNYNEFNPTTFAFYPYDKAGDRLSIELIETNYPLVFDYFSEFKDQLIGSNSKNENNWIYPHRSRNNYILQPKIVTPHLVFNQKFSLDVGGEYLVTRSPFFTMKKDKKGKTTRHSNDLLKYFTAVLNSSACYWYIYTHSHRYNSGYSMLEVKTLRSTPVPNPNSVSPGTLNKISRLVEDRIYSTGYDAIKIERKLDSIISEIYGLTEQDQIALGIID